MAAPAVMRAAMVTARRVQVIVVFMMAISLSE
jgi:hypothetical protein